MMNIEMNLKEIAKRQEKIAKKQEELAKEQEEIAKKQEEHAKEQERLQKAFDFQSQRVIALEKTAFESLKEIVKITGSSDIVDEVAHKVKVFPISGKAEQASKNEEPNQTEQADEIIEPEQVEESVEAEDDTTEEVLPPLASLVGKDNDTIPDALIYNPDPYEYKDEEEYNQIKKREKMMPPLCALLFGDTSSKIQTMGYIQVKGKKDFKQHLRAINAEGGGGNTLTTEISPWLYIPEELVKEPVEIATHPEMKECA